MVFAKFRVQFANFQTRFSREQILSLLFDTRIFTRRITSQLITSYRDILCMYPDVMAEAADVRWKRNEWVFQVFEIARDLDALGGKVACLISLIRNFVASLYGFIDHSWRFSCIIQFLALLLRGTSLFLVNDRREREIFENYLGFIAHLFNNNN